MNSNDFFAFLQFPATILCYPRQLNQLMENVKLDIKSLNKLPFIHVNNLWQKMLFSIPNEPTEDYQNLTPHFRHFLQLLSQNWLCCNKKVK